MPSQTGVPRLYSFEGERRNEYNKIDKRLGKTISRMPSPQSLKEVGTRHHEITSVPPSRGLTPPRHSHARAYVAETFTRVGSAAGGRLLEIGRGREGDAITIKFTQELYAARARMIIGAWERS